MELIAKATALVGGTVALMRRMGSPSQQAFGAHPAIPEARKQGIMTLKMPVAEGWKDGRLPTCAPGLAVNAFASGLDHPRWIEVLPNGDVLVAESKEQPGPPKTLMDHATQATMRRVKAIGKSANRVTPLARCRWRRRGRDPRGLCREPEPALRHGAGRRDASISATPTGSGSSITRTATRRSRARAKSSSTSSRTATGRAA